MRIIGCIVILALLVFFNWALDVIMLNIDFGKIFEAVIRRIQVVILSSFFFIVNILPATLIHFTVVICCGMALYEVWSRRHDIMEKCLD